MNEEICGSRGDVTVVQDDRNACIFKVKWPTEVEGTDSSMTQCHISESQSTRIFMANKDFG